jgi:Tol biopolymer transport system component
MLLTTERRGPLYVSAGTALLCAALITPHPEARSACAPATVMSPQGDGEGSAPSLSSDGRFMAFASSADDLVPNDAGFSDIFVFDRATCDIELVSVSLAGTGGNGHSFDPAISDDGRFVVFESSASNLASDTNSSSDIFLRDRLLGTTAVVSVDSNGVQPASGLSRSAEISGNGQVAIFISLATTLVPGDSNGEADVFVRDLVAGTTDRVSVSSTGTQGDSPSVIGVSEPALSADGRYAVFASLMNTLVPGDLNGLSDVFLRDRSAGTTVRVSVTSAGQEVSTPSLSPAISDDGALVAFENVSSFNLAPGDGTCDGIFLREIALSATSCLPLRPPTGFPGASATKPRLSGDGRYVAFRSQGSYVAGDSLTPDVYVQDRQTGITRRASTASLGIEGNSTVTSGRPGLSADGQFVAFASFASNLVPDDTNAFADVFVAHWPMLPDPPLTNLSRNGTFANALQGWQTFATPDPSYIVTQVTGGVLEFYRDTPPPGTTNQAVVFQHTTSRFLAHATIEARVDLGNSSGVRKRITVLLHDSDFSDLSVCTFWLPAGAPLRTYVVRSHTTQFWDNATISFYAASAGSDGGFYRVDNVLLTFLPGQDDDRTDCVDPLAPPPPGGAAGPELLLNGSFDPGLPPWSTFGQIVSQITNGIFEFYRPAGTPAGVIAQQTGHTITTDEIVTANFYLGNSSSVRKRVTVLLHDASFQDLSACTFWLPPGLPLAPYRLRSYVTAAWTSATVSIYPATVGDDPWIQLDNVSLQVTPAASTDGTNCLEPGADIQRALQNSDAITRAPATGTTGPRLAPPSLGNWRALTAGGMTDGVVTVWQDAIDVTEASDTRLVFESQFRTSRSRASVELSLDGLHWLAAASILASDDWLAWDVGLDPGPGPMLYVRIRFEPRGSEDELRVRTIQLLRRE